MKIFIICLVFAMAASGLAVVLGLPIWPATAIYILGGIAQRALDWVDA